MKESESLGNKAALLSYKSAIARYIRSAMVLNDIKYDDLVEALADRGVILTASNLRNKVSKGLFSADMLVMLIEILKVEETALIDILKQAHHDPSR